MGLNLKILRERAFQAIGGGIILSFCFGWILKDEMTGVSVESFWTMKLDWNGCADLVLAGDSRVYRGLAPAVFRAELGGMRTLNFGFSGLGYSPQYLDAVEALLDPLSKRRGVVLGIGPLNFLSQNVEQNGFLVENRKTPAERFIARTFGGLLHFYRRVEPREAVQRASGWELVRYYQDFRPDGWVASYKLPENPNEFVPASDYAYEQRSAKGVLGSAAEALLMRVRSWKANGIAVYALRVPCAERLMRLEEVTSPVDLDRFREKFESYGGVWIEVQPSRFRYYDGSHLHKDSALSLSKAVAERISRQLRCAPDELLGFRRSEVRTGSH